MKTHIENLTEHIPDLLDRKILDIGSGKGDFVLNISKKGGNVVELEINPENIKKTKEVAAREGLKITLIEGKAENLPFSDKKFGFINIAEVIEHVSDPELLLKETYRVLDSNGCAYISVPNRFCFKDPHFDLYFVNWIPRFMSSSFISLFGKHKYYSDRSGRQRLDEMYYDTFTRAKQKMHDVGFLVLDIRLLKIQKSLGVFRYIAIPVYIFARFFYFDTFHFILKK